MRFSPHHLKRYKDIGLLLLRHSQPGMNSRFVTTIQRPGMGGEGARADAQQLPSDLERLGPTFVKLGQLLSSRADLLPDPYLEALSRLQDKVQPFPFQDVEFTVENELGTRINKAFCEFSKDPLAAASLGQVHLARLHNGRRVVVKVQRPNGGYQIEQDFAALKEMAGFLNRHTRFGQRYQLSKILEEFESTVANELDYTKEAGNMQKLANNLRDFSRIKVPLPVDDYTTKRVLTMEYVEGFKITELSPLMRLDLEGDNLAEQLFRAYLKQILVDGVFHADPHPGNVLLTPDQQIALLDLGMVGYTTPAMQDNLLKLLLAVSEGQSDNAAETAIRISQPATGFDERDFRHRIALLVAAQQNAILSQIDVGRMILELGRAAANTGLYVPTEISMLGKTLLQLDAVGRSLAPDFNPTDCIRRNASSMLNEKMKGTFSEAKVYASVLEAKEFISALPTRVNRILDAVGRAELNVNVKPGETEFLLDSAQKVANRITTGLVLAALIVGAALLMQVQTRFQLFGYPGLAMICFLTAAAGGFGLILNIVWGDHKSRRRSRR